MDTFNTPAYQGEKDFANQPEHLKEEFLRIWSNFVNYSTLNSIMGNPWTSKYDHPRDWYYNPLKVSVPPSSSNTVPIQWTAFPNRIIHYFQDEFDAKFKSEADDKLHELADIGPDAFEAKYKMKLRVTDKPCNPAAKGTKPFGPGGPRGWQDEYCEWSVTRDTNGDITCVNFTHENPEYWFHMWHVSPEVVLSLYREILQNQSIQLPDLYLYEGKKPVIVRETGRPAYNPINKWNCGPSADANGGGAIHLTSPPNSVGAEIYLGAAATIIREQDGKVIQNADQLICSAKYGQIFRNSDPRIGFSVNQLVYKNNLKISLTNPIALYGQEPNFNLFTMPKGANKTIEDCYTVVRGVTKNTGDTYYPNNMILHSKFTLPEGANFKLSDILVNGKPLKWGSQIADTFKVQLSGTGTPASAGQKPTPLPGVEPSDNPLPNVAYLLDYNLLVASLQNQLPSLSNLSSNITQVESGTVTKNLGIYAYNVQFDKSGKPLTQFDFGTMGIQTEVKSFQKIDKTEALFLVDLSVAASVPAGEKPLALYNQNTDHRYPISGVLEVVPAGSLPQVKAEPLELALIEKKQLTHLKSMLS